MSLNKESSPKVDVLLVFRQEELLALAAQHKKQLTLVRAFRAKYGLTVQEANELRREIVCLKHDAAGTEA